MRYIALLAGLGLILAVTGTAGALTSTWDVATVHGVREFTIGSGNSSLLYHQQGWTDYVWYENNGSAPGTLATTTKGEHAPTLEPRSGMRTFAATDVAVGQQLSDITLVYEYNNTLGGYVTMNFFMTDGLGHYGIFSPASGGINAVAYQDILNGWTRMTLDLTQATIPDAAAVAVYEHNGLSNEYGVPFTSMTWGDIKGFTIAGMYDYQRSPTGGWDAWGTSFDANHGLALIWGDTANSNNSYGSQTREIRNVSVTFGGEDYIGTFNDATVPEPVTLAGLALGIGCLARYVRRRRAL
ncbi:MAG TPA: PEP-CTERM sorting domain-containing protein [Phycisphaerae bacterium]|nr:PEP-CTERM sorting domain-containing protein [Phycisphaerae bacterium]